MSQNYVNTMINYIVMVFQMTDMGSGMLPHPPM